MLRLLGLTRPLASCQATAPFLCCPDQHSRSQAGAVGGIRTHARVYCGLYRFEFYILALKIWMTPMMDADGDEDEITG